MTRRLSDLPAGLAAEIAGHDLIVFDGECVLCSSFYRFVLRFDRRERFRFATAQSPLGQRLYAALGLDTRNFETNLVILGGRVYDHLDSFAATMDALGWPWRTLSAVGWLPVGFKDLAYRWIARNRFRLLGRYDTCLVPDAVIRQRFLAEGW